jgi:hypothetical protein
VQKLVVPPIILHKINAQILPQNFGSKWCRTTTRPSQIGLYHSPELFEIYSAVAADIKLGEQLVSVL